MFSLYTFRLLVCTFLFLFFCLMIRPPPRSTRTDTLFPYTTLFRSRGYPQFLGDAIGYFEIGDPLGAEALVVGRIIVEATEFIVARFLDVDHERSRLEIGAEDEFRLRTFGEPALSPAIEHCRAETPAFRSEERRVGKACVNTCRSRWSPLH